MITTNKPQDASFDKTNFAQVQSVLGPKITGTINLHHATEHLPLDFFLMTSSITALVGTATQAVYVAGNAFQDAFARFRLSRHLPATALQLGLILEIGATVNSVGLQQSFQRSVTYGISETEFLQLVEGALVSGIANDQLSKVDPGSLAQIATGFEPSRFIPFVTENRMDDLIWYNSPRFSGVVQAIVDRAHVRHTGGVNGANGGASSTAKKLEQATTPAEKDEIARAALVERLGELLSISASDIDADRSMSDYGLDSLVTTELRSWLMKTFGVDVNPLQLLSKSTKIKGLVKMLI